MKRSELQESLEAYCDLTLKQRNYEKVTYQDLQTRFFKKFIKDALKNTKDKEK